jgi:hypothetical protein
LSRSRGENRKTIDRVVQPEEALQNTGEEVCTCPLESILVELHLDAQTAGKPGPILAEDPCILGGTLDSDDAVDVIPAAPRR